MSETPEEVAVVTAAVKKEAEKWWKFSENMDPIKSAAGRLTLGRDAFFIGDNNAEQHFAAYLAFQVFMVGVLQGAFLEFAQISVVLEKIAKAYDDADSIVSFNLDELWSAKPLDPPR